MWDDWKAIEAAQAAVDAPAPPPRPTLRVVPPPEPVESVAVEPWRPAAAVPPPRPALTDEQRLRGLKALRKALANSFGAR